jgi:hypothetical protein
MRKVLPYAFLLLSMAAVACSDSPTSGPGLQNVSSFARSRVGAVDALILQLFPRGLETATGKRWDHIDAVLGEWNPTTMSWTGTVEDARKHLLDLTKFVDLKTNDIEAANLTDGETKEHAKDRLMYAMNAYFFGGPDAIGALPEATSDFAVQVVLQGQAALVQAPSLNAGVRLDAGSTNEDRVISVFGGNHTQAARCEGPLQTDRCQYPLFYRFESFPHLKLAKSARFAVCTVFDENGPTHTEHDYIQLAHELPEDPANYTTHTPGAVQEAHIELLPRATTSTDVVSCDEPPHEDLAGVVGAVKRFLYAAAKLAETAIAPKAAYAYDQGPEHLGDFFSYFVGVGAPSLIGTWNGTTRLSGSSTVGQPVTVIITDQTDQGVQGEYRVDQAGTPPFVAYNSRPSDGLGRLITTSSVGFNGASFTIDPFYSPFSSGIKLEHSVTRSYNTDGVAMLTGTTVRTSLIDGVLVTDNWELSLTRGDAALVAAPPPPIIVSLRAAPTSAIASSTMDAPIQ